MEEQLSKIPQRPLPRTGFYLLSFFRWAFISFVVGAIVGAVASFFNHTLKFVTEFRIANPWTLLLLPVAGLIIVFLYRTTKTAEPKGTNLVIEAVRREDSLPAKMAPLIFISTALTHLFGGSAGREGAALQLGGSLGQLIANIGNIEESQKHIVVMCGMSAAFSALFGTPIAAAIFSLELASIGVMHYYALVPCTIASVTAVSIASLSGIAPERFQLEEFLLTPLTAIQITVLAILCAGVSIVFCLTLHSSGHLAKKLFPNQYIRVLAGGCMIIVLTYLFGTRDYLGAGMNIIEIAIEGKVVLWAFILKLLFTAITLGSGFKGGEIVPTFFVGATFGCAAAGFIGLSPSLGAALGMIALFCGVTNCPITAMLLAFEMFSFSSPVLFLITVSISYMLSGYYSLYSTQKIIHSKTMPVVLNRNAH